MMPFRLIITLTVLLASISSAVAKEYHVYYLGGQSNMDGYGKVSELTGATRARQEKVMIFHGSSSPDGSRARGAGLWAPLRPGHGYDFRSDGKTNSYGTRFGCELTFASEIKRLKPDENIAIIKYSRGGTSIAIEAARHYGCWHPDFRDGDADGKGINQYDHFLATLRRAFEVRDIDGDGETDQLIPAGIVWMQGESDAGFEVPAREYGANLAHLMDLFRAAFRTDDLPVAVGRISDSKPNGKRLWPYGDIVRKQQETYCTNDSNAILVLSTDDYGYSDVAHYDSQGYLDLGTQFARAVHSLQRPRNVTTTPE